MVRSWWCVLVVVAAVWMPQRAHAARVAVLLPHVSGSRDTSAASRDAFRNSIAGGLTASGHDVVAMNDVDVVMRRTPALASCDTDTCFRKLGELVGAHVILRPNVEVLGSSNYQVRLDAYDVGERGLITSVEDACAICTVREANEAMSRAAQEAGRRLAKALAPANPAPVTPAQNVEAAPPPPAPVPDTSTSRSRVYLGLGVTALVLGLGGVGAGAALIAIDGRVHTTAPTATDPNVERSVTHTLVPGVVVTAAGAVLVAGGSILLWRSSVARHRR